MATHASARLSRVGGAFRTLRTYLIPRPNTGRLWLDVVYILLIGALHHTVLPSFTRSLFVVDLMTPWIVTTFVVASLPRAAFLGAVAALVLESHSAAPVGLYMCAYWVIAVALNLTRTTLSWRHVFPWIVTLALAELWVMVFESFVSIHLGGIRLDPMHLASQGLRLLTSTAAGLIMARHVVQDEPRHHQPGSAGMGP